MSSFEKRLRDTLHQGDPVALKALMADLYEAYGRLSLYVARQILPNPEDAEDAVSETFVSFFNNLVGHRDVKSIKYYLLNSTRFIAYKKKKMAEKQTSYDDDISGAEPPHDVASLLDEEAALRSFQGVLSKEEMEIVVDHLELGLTFREIGLAHHTTGSAISSKYKRIIDKLRLHYLKEARR
ncbi:MAG: RNA polymerase sigma factor SigX [Tenericutes bacterium ADurb.BinA155]|nr:MAG: RNA polymerase sigma factor SigX [Tenericutes bacterium ADurb.BinA155]